MYILSVMIHVLVDYISRCSIYRHLVIHVHFVFVSYDMMSKLLNIDIEHFYLIVLNDLFVSYGLTSEQQYFSYIQPMNMKWMIK